MELNCGGQRYVDPWDSNVPQVKKNIPLISFVFNTPSSKDKGLYKYLMDIVGIQWKES